jgi:hypothetical protein
MSFKILALALLFILVGCDTPTRSRPIPNLSGSETYTTTPGNSSTSSSGFGPANGSTTGQTSSGGSTTNSPTRPPGFENCSFTITGYAAGIGQIYACQSSADETQIGIKSTQTNQDRTCLIPMYKDQNGGSTYLSKEPQCFIQTSGSEVFGKLSKTRAGFQNHPLNALMIMKYNSLSAFYTCMDALTTFADPRCPMGMQTPPYQQNVYPYAYINCMQLAQARMNQICSDFKTMHSYVELKLK